ncbi:ImmA/IrrE family metallo-endopeptidase [Streptomyces sp. NPDC049040]|uniref:ImmA/IrrE family metallo-endopeptidase n=1 Tax=Streptomyces sp. NPDC049040 TaxID=3365593 RepID=UPI0037102C4F
MGQRWTRQALEELALEERARIGAGPNAALDLSRLTLEWGVPVYATSELAEQGCTADALEHFAVKGARKWSAALVRSGTGYFIVENCSHSPQRRRSNVAHEMAHLLLEHEFDTVLFADDGCRSLDTSMKKQEEQALNLSAELLIPKKAAIKAAIAGWADEQVAQHFDVSIEFARMRMNPSGARAIARRYLAKRA